MQKPKKKKKYQVSKSERQKFNFINSLIFENYKNCFNL